MLKLWWRSLFLAGVFSLSIVPVVQVRVFAQSSISIPSPVTVTSVRLNQTDSGLEIFLETTSKQPLSIVTSGYGKTFVANITNARLDLPEGNSFRQENPNAGIAIVSVTPQGNNGIRVSAIGSEGLPTAKVRQSNGNSIFSLTAPVAPTAQTPVPPPTIPQTPTQPEATTPEAEGESTPPSAPEPADTAPGEEMEIVVTGEQDGYSVTDTSTGTKTDTPLRDIPQSIQVVPQQVLRDQNINSLEDATRNVSGVTGTRASYVRDGAVTIRGFQSSGFTGNLLRNGLRDPRGGLGLEFANVDRVEVLKGPASVLFGLGSPGGTINIVTKQPLREPFYAVEGTIGNYDFYRGAIDLSGPLNSSKTIAYRLNAAYQDNKGFIDFQQDKIFFIAPVLSFDIGKNTKLTLEAEYRKWDFFFLLGQPAVGSVLPTGIGRLPRNLNYSESPIGDDDTFGITTSKAGYRLEHKLSENWSIRSSFLASFYRANREFLYATSLDSDNRTLNRGYELGEYDDNIFNLDTNILGTFSTGSIQHQLLFGFDLYRVNEYRQQYVTGTAAPLDLFNPVYGQPIGPITDRGDTSRLTDSLGIYIQDQITLADNLKLLLGGRFDTFKQTTEDFIEDTEQEQTGDAFSPRIGIVYQPIEPISLYASYIRSFTPAIGRSFDNNQFQPERGTQYEVGIKADLNEQLSATLALYDLTRSNVLTDDPLNEGFSIQTGKQNSQGIELNVSGEILPGWNVFGGYAYTDARIREDETFDVGNRLNNTPENAFNLWTTYEIQQGSLQGLGFGLGLYFVGERQGDLANTFQAPSYFRTDASIFYKRDRFRAALNFRNLFDADYFEAALNRFRVFYGEPFTVQGTVSWEF
ncbi:TonB-dependent siderophore receptor [Chroococcidiopsis sp. CCNUC1]|uniref:TonB-dependent siderophore receptor n=1 Tax=Chroococcidiopsis sp. CCNUC1 TaxID=2653189 RepID=UPI00202094C0|nr:TonB-dependent siderophore receptor [Chroococcidiopsis sp. CCNUC1]URD50062.1 TonB-dependent siderophore receptor [Chroococcidiopsis sp. CCNUC1]